MDAIQVFILALIQGLTEFLPVSSSAHLILPSSLLGWTDQGRAFDVAAHFGTLAAITAHCRKHWQAWFQTQNLLSVTTRNSFLWLSLATLPLVLFGLVVAVCLPEEALRVAWVIGLCNIFFAALLYRADRRAETQLASGCSELPINLATLGWHRALVLGVAQSFAVIPGASRSGLVMTAALEVGLQRQMAVQISYLMAIPAILAASCYGVLQLILADDDAQATNGVPALIAVAVIAGIIAWLTAGWLVRWVERHGFLPFVIYRLLLGAILLVIPSAQQASAGLS